jgi:hypothetical protein
VRLRLAHQIIVADRVFAVILFVSSAPRCKSMKTVQSLRSVTLLQVNVPSKHAILMMNVEHKTVMLLIVSAYSVLNITNVKTQITIVLTLVNVRQLTVIPIIFGLHVSQMNIATRRISNANSKCARMETQTVEVVFVIPQRVNASHVIHLTVLLSLVQKVMHASVMQHA